MGPGSVAERITRRRKGDDPMNDRDVKSIVSGAVAAAQPLPEKYYHVCWWDKAVQCHPVRHTKEAHEVFFSAPGSIFLDELSEFQWKLLTERMEEFCRQRGITLDAATGRRQNRAARRAHRRWVTQADSQRLHSLLTHAAMSESELYGYQQQDRLKRLLDAANIVAPREVPADVVTMNSQVRLRNNEDGQEKSLFLVFPADVRSSDPAQPKLSILTRTGVSMLGRRVGEAIDGRLRIVGLPYQPEAAGDFDL